MSRSKRIAAAIGVVIAVGLTAAPANAAPKSTVLFTFQDPRIDEASGIAVASRSPDVVFVQNDSGDSARFFAVDRRTGKTLAVYDVPGAKNVDWEDIAVSAAYGPYVWLADIGDNDETRSEVQIYRVDEPKVPANGAGQTLQTSMPTVWRLRYPDGPHDAEAIVANSAGDVYVITKSIVGRSGVYRIPDFVRPDVQTMDKVGVISLSLTGTPGPFAPVGQLTVTGAAEGNDYLVVRTYTDAYLWQWYGDLAQALKGTRKRFALPQQKQGEGIAIDGNSMLIDSEGVGSPVYSIPIGRPFPIATGSARILEPPTPPKAHGWTATTLLLVFFGGSVAFFAVGFAATGLVVLIRRRRRRV